MLLAGVLPIAAYTTAALAWRVTWLDGVEQLQQQRLGCHGKLHKQQHEKEHKQLFAHAFHNATGRREHAPHRPAASCTHRDELFSMVNSLPTCYEVVSGKAKATTVAPRKRATEGSGGRPQQRQRMVSSRAASVSLNGCSSTGSNALIALIESVGNAQQWHMERSIHNRALSPHCRLQLQPFVLESAGDGHILAPCCCKGSVPWRTQQ